MINEQELNKALDKLKPIFAQAYAVAVLVIAMKLMEDTRGNVDTKKVGTGDTTK